MATNTLQTRIILKNDTAANWASSNLVLLAGELAIESDTRKVKIGNGTDVFADLKYINLTPEEVQALIEAANHTHDNKSILDATTASFTTTLLNKLNGIASGAEVNQNAFSNITVGSTTVSADSKTDTLTLVGSNVTITPDADNDKLTFTVANGTTSAKGIVQLTNSTSSTSTTTAATPNSVKTAYDLANTAKTAAANAQATADGKVGSVSLATGSSNGQVALTVDGTTTNVSVKGLGTAAYTASSAYATAAQGTKADNAMPKSGGTFTGAVTLKADPTANLGVATKQYVDSSLNTAKSYADTKVAALVGTAPETLDTLEEVAAAIEAHQDVTDALNASIGNKVDKVSGKGLSTNDLTNTLKSNYDTAYTHSQSAHAPSGAQANVIETIKVNGIALAPSSKAVDIIVPTKVSALTNDSGYITSSGTAKTISDTLPLSKGGTGQTTAIDAANVLINSLGAGDTAPTDDTNIVVQGVGNYSNKFYRKPVSLLLNYIKSKLATVATSGSYNDLSNKPTIPSVGNGTVTIKQAGTSKGTFTMNQSGDTTIELTDNNTTYSAGTGLALSGTTFNHKNSVTAGTAQGDASKTLTFGGTFTVPTVSYDAQGHVTGKGTTTMTMPATPTSVSGNAGSATKLATARTVDGVSFNGTGDITHYGICETTAGTAAKVVSLAGFTLATGARVMVKFTVTNTASSPTLNVNGTGAKSIMYRGAVISAGYLAANRVYEFVYDGTNYEFVGDINVDTNTDTKVTNTLATTTKAYVTGTTSSSTNTGTQVFDTGVYLDTTAGQITATTFKGALSGNATTATTATKANKLTNARTIGLGTAVTATAQSFDGSGNITIPITAVNSDYLINGENILILNCGGAS